MFGPAENCINCKLLSSEIFFNSKKERICSVCLQKEHNIFVQKNQELEHKINVYYAIIEQIKNFTQLVELE